MMSDTRLPQWLGHSPPNDRGWGRDGISVYRWVDDGKGGRAKAWQFDLMEGHEERIDILLETANRYLAANVWEPEGGSAEVVG